MKTRSQIGLVLSIPVVVILGGFGFMYQDVLLADPVWMFAGLFAMMVWLAFVVLLFSINKQVDTNPYYTDMVIRKRDEVRQRQKAYASAHKTF